MNKNNLIKNFWRVGNNGDRNLYEDDLGWNEASRKDARSDYSEYIFRYFVEDVGLNILFYWLEDRNFYAIKTEKTPVEFLRIKPNPNWDGKCELTKADSDLGPTTASEGELLQIFENPSEIWSHLSINGVSLEAILEKSVIIEMD
ncbi:MAG: hypothetical protein ACI31F_06440 [Muribaculaceae bacterium]